jgi:hypothetical protein
MKHRLWLTLQKAGPLQLAALPAAVLGLLFVLTVSEAGVLPQALTQGGISQQRKPGALAPAASQAPVLRALRVFHLNAALAVSLSRSPATLRAAIFQPAPLHSLDFHQLAGISLPLLN